MKIKTQEVKTTKRVSADFDIIIEKDGEEKIMTVNKWYYEDQFETDSGHEIYAGKDVFDGLSDEDQDEVLETIYSYPLY